jgi:multiple sugar transport system substrate-binding protein
MNGVMKGLRLGTMAALALSASVVGLTTAAQAGTVRVTVAYYSAETEPYFRKMAEAFNKANPGTEIKIEVVNWDTLLQKLTTDISGNANADLSIIGTRWLVDFVKQDLVEPLDGYMDAAFKDRFIGTFLSPAQIDSKNFGLPIAASARALYYNKEQLAKAGFPDGPKSWDDVVAASRKLKAAGMAGFGLQGKEVETDVYYYYGLWSNGGDVIGKDGKAAFNSAAGLKALTTYKTLIDEGLTQAGPTSNSREDVQNLFKQGRVSMVITAPFLINQIKKEVPNLPYGITSLPSGGTDVTYGVTDSIVMFKNSKVKKEAWAFLDYLFTKEPRVEFTKGEGFLPTTKAEASDPYFTGNKELQSFVNLLPVAKFAPLVEGWEGVAEAVIRNVQAVYLGKAAPADALKAAEADANKALGK